MIRVFHTSDVHVGLPFASCPDQEVGDALRQARIDVVTRMVATANEEKCDLFVVAGDLFENRRVKKAAIRATAEAIAGFDGLAVVLPGNHDFYEGDDDKFWRGFVNALGENHLLLREPQEYDLTELGCDGVVLYPGVCREKHSHKNAIGWVQPEVEADDTDRIRIGIAHGSLEGVSPDFNKQYYPMGRTELMAAKVDMWLLGHTHIRVPDCEQGTDERIFFPSVPEPDGFSCEHTGFAWIHEVEQGGQVSYRSVDTGKFRFQHENAVLTSLGDVEELETRCAGFDNQRDLVKVRISGCLDSDAIAELDTVLDRVTNQVLDLREVDRSGLVLAIQREDLDRQFTEDSFPHQLLSALVEDEADRLALQLARELIEEAKS